MEFSKKVEMIVVLRNSSLTIWGFLLTVSLGIIAYLAGLKGDVDYLSSAFIVLLFVLFAFSNYKALKKNIDIRQEILFLAKNDKDYKEYSKLLTLNVPSDDTLKYMKLFHVLIDALVILVIIYKAVCSYA